MLVDLPLRPARSRLTMCRRLPLVLLASFGIAGTAYAQQAAAPRPVYLDESRPISQRVDDLVGRMTLDEKVLQMKDVAPAIDRLAVPSYNWWNEALHGVARDGLGTAFPQALRFAATR